MQRTARPNVYLADLPAGWSVAVQWDRQQMYATWHNGKIWHYDTTADEARRYVDMWIAGANPSEARDAGNRQGANPQPARAQDGVVHEARGH